MHLVVHLTNEMFVGHMQMKMFAHLDMHLTNQMFVGCIQMQMKMFKVCI